MGLFINETINISIVEVRKAVVGFPGFRHSLIDLHKVGSLVVRRAGDGKEGLEGPSGGGSGALGGRPLIYGLLRA